MPIRRTLAIATPLIVATVAAAGCLWLPDWPIPAKIDPETPEDPDADLIAFCTPRPRRLEPVLVGPPDDSRDVRCRIRGAATVTWSLRGIEGTEMEEVDLTLATGVERIVLHRSSLPWSPRPYEIELVLRAEREDGGGGDESWPLRVVPGGGDLLSPPEPDTSGEEGGR